MVQRPALGLIALCVLLSSSVPALADPWTSTLVVTESSFGSCAGLRVSISADGVGPIYGTGVADVISAGDGDDLIYGGGGNDTICAGSGDDRVFGGIGSDWVKSGPGEDRLEGGNGSDRLWGESGTDLVLGNRGNDRLYSGAGARDYADGGLGDDHLDGGSGNFDQVVGGIGNDEVFGGPGRGDLLRGDHGADRYDGGSGLRDVASFAVSGFQGPVLGGQGVAVDLSAGRADRDGADRLERVEDVIGTAFDDVIRGDSAMNTFYGGGGDDQLGASGAADIAFGGAGSDSCDGFVQAHSCGREEPIRSAVLEVGLAGGLASASLNVIVRPPKFIPGAPVDSSSQTGTDISISFDNGSWSIAASPIPVAVGEGCFTAEARQAHCPVSGTPDAVLVSGGSGSDEIEIAPGVPSTVSAIVQGDRGADLLLGGPGDDSLDGAPSDTSYPTDTILGRGGDDAITHGALLAGGSGSDLLIGLPCVNQNLKGGRGVDSASFARATPGWGVSLELGGDALVAGHRRGSGSVEGSCPVPGSLPTRIDRSIENVEGSPEDDLLVGDAASNILLGRGGDDVLIGRGGDDFLVGGLGVDSIFGGAGWDRLYARDGIRDKELSCGGAGRRDVVSLDDADPAAPTCRRLP